MLFFRDGCVFDTDDSSNQKVSIDEIIKALKLGINIQGVYLNSNNSLEVYDFVNSNIQRLQSFVFAVMMSNQLISLLQTLDYR